MRQGVHAQIHLASDLNSCSCTSHVLIIITFTLIISASSSNKKLSLAEGINRILKQNKTKNGGK